MTEILTYVSGYTNKEGKGIYSYTFNSDTGHLSQQQLAYACSSPSYFVIHPQSKQLFIVQETSEYNGEKGTGGIGVYQRLEEIEEIIEGKKQTRVLKTSKKLKHINSQPTGGEDPCYIYVHGHYCLVANYTGGSTTCFSISKENGISSNSGGLDDFASDHCIRYKDHGILPTLGNPDRQKACHAHAIDLDPIEYKHAIVMDLGADLALLHRYHQGNLTLLDDPSKHFQFPKGTGPRHLVFSPNMRHFIYVLGELSNQLFMLEFNPSDSQLNLVQQISALPEGIQAQKDWTGAEIRITPNGKFLYCTIRGHDSISIFYVDERNGKLKFIANQPSGGEHPRYFIIDPNGKFLLIANQFSNNIVTYKIDQDTGKLSHVQTIDHPEPTCIQFWD